MLGHLISALGPVIKAVFLISCLILNLVVQNMNAMHECDRPRDGADTGVSLLSRNAGRLDWPQSSTLICHNSHLTGHKHFRAMG